MRKELEGIPTNKKPDAQFEEQMALMKKSVEEAVRYKVAALEGKISTLEANQRRASLPPNFLGPMKPFVKSFDEHLEEEAVLGNMTFDQAYERHMELAAESISKTKYTGVRPSLAGMSKSLGTLQRTRIEASVFRTEYDAMQKSFNDDPHAAWEKMSKSILGDSGTPGAPGAWYNFLEENLSRYIQRIMLSNEDATALMSIPTAITSSIVPEVPRLKTYGVGYGKHTMGFPEGWTAKYGGSQLMDRLTNTLVQRGIRAAATEMLLANKQKIVDRNPLALERELRTLEFNLGKNHGLLHGNPNINKNGSVVLEVSGMKYQMEDATDGYPDHVIDWNGVAFDATTNNPLKIFREVAEKLIVNGHLPGGVITGKYSVLMDYGVANHISTVVDEKQRVMIEKYEQAAMYYGQAFTGVVTDLGTFRFKRSKTLHLTANDSWTPDDDVSNNAIAWPAIAPTAIAEAQTTEPKAVPVGNYRYRFTVVNDHGESDVSDAIVTTSEGTTPDPVGASEIITVSIPYDAAFAGGTVGGYEVSPARYFNIYRGNAGEDADTEANDKLMSCIAQVPINGTSTTVYTDYNQKIPRTTDMFFISNNPMDIAHISLVPAFEIPLYDIDRGSTRQWMIMDIAGLAVWAPQRNFIVTNVPGIAF